VIELTAVVPHDCFKPIDLPPEQKPTFIMFDMKQLITVSNLGLSIIAIIIIIPVGT